MSNDDFNRIDSIVPESDERIGRGRGKAYATQASLKGSDSNKARGTLASLSAHSYKLLVFIAVIAGYLFVSQGLQLTRLQDRFSELEAKIISTDESLDQSGELLVTRIETQESALVKHWSEIRKLWAIAYDQNRKDISQQQEKIKSQDSALEKLITLVANQKKELASMTGKLNKSAKTMNTMVGSSLAAKSEISDLAVQLRGLSITDFNARIADNEQAIKAIDAHRLSVNREIQELKERLSGKP
jgi:hypothetical protein|tara:strand:- start:18331 stop:19062 length:732 start_codon:yes stop_codon:yes gene_type:complete